MTVINECRRAGSTLQGLCAWLKAQCFVILSFFSSVILLTLKLFLNGNLALEEDIDKEDEHFLDHSFCSLKRRAQRAESKSARRVLCDELVAIRHCTLHTI